MNQQEFSEEQLKDIREYIQEAQYELCSCFNCQPAGRDADDIWIGGDQTDVYDLILNTLEAPEEYLEEIAEFLVCPNCSTELDFRAEVGVSSRDDKTAFELWDKWEETFGEKYKKFHEHLEQLPYLGLIHDLGKELLEETSKFPKIAIEDRIGYRARNIDCDVRTSQDMLPPPLDARIPEGRYNHFGQRVFYLANSKEGAANEVLESQGEVWIQKFYIVNTKNILDLTIGSFEKLRSEYSLLSFGILFGELLTERVERREGWRPEYFIPRFIADCAKQNGFNGIRYPSSRWLKDNLVLFNWEEDNIRPSGNPEKFFLKEGHVSLTHSSYMSGFWAPDSSDIIEHQLEKFNEKHGLHIGARERLPFDS